MDAEKRPTVVRFVRRLPLAAFVLLGFVVSGCATPRAVVDTPEGFAAYASRREPYRALTPEGVILRARVDENKPQQALSFWRDTLRNHMTSVGYPARTEDEFERSGGAGFYFEWVAPVGDEDWYYLTAVSVFDDSIAVVEAAGEHSAYTGYREAILSTLSTLRIE